MVVQPVDVAHDPQQAHDPVSSAVQGDQVQSPVRALGAVTGNQAVQQVAAGLKAIYVSGWQVAADANTAGQMYPDQSLYPADSVPELVRRLNRALQIWTAEMRSADAKPRHRCDARADGPLGVLAARPQSLGIRWPRRRRQS